jgi:hypothetical protein
MESQSSNENHQQNAWWILEERQHRHFESSALQGVKLISSLGLGDRE